MAITYRINSYEEHIKHDLELNVTDVPTGMTGILRLTRDKGYKLIFNGIKCDVRQIKEKLDTFGVESLKVLAYDEFNSFGERTLVFDFKYDFNENHRFFDFSGNGHRCKILNVTVDQVRCCRCITLRDFDAAEDFCLIIEDRDFGIFGGNLSDLDCAAIYREWIVKKIEVMPVEASERAMLKKLWVSDDYETKEKEYAKKTVVVPSGAINGSAFRTDTIHEPRWLTYDPARIQFDACDFIKEEKEMKKENNAQAVWNSMSKAQQELCCNLIGNAAKGRISEEIKMAVINTKISRYSGKVRGEDIRDIIFNGPATIILWRDGTKTVVKQQKGDKWDPEKAVALAVMKKAFGTNATGSDYLDYVKPYIQKAYEDEKKRKVAARCKSNAKKKAETES